MLAPRTLSLGKRVFLLGPVLAVAFLCASRAFAFAPAGTNQLTLSGQVTITSRLGTETISLNGTATVTHGDTYLQGGVEVADTEITAMNLTGNSLTGPITVVESPTLASTGKLESLQAPPDSFPASSFFDVFVRATIPASGPSGQTATLHNDTALHLVPYPNNGITWWPPGGVTYAATPNPCAALVPSQPKGICITGASFTMPVTVGGMAELTNIGASPAAGRGAAADTWSPNAVLVAVVAALAAVAVALSGAAWARRRLR